MVFAGYQISHDGFEDKAGERRSGKSRFRLAAVLKVLFTGKFG